MNASLSSFTCPILIHACNMNIFLHVYIRCFILLVWLLKIVTIFPFFSAFYHLSNLFPCFLTTFLFCSFHFAFPFLLFFFFTLTIFLFSFFSVYSLSLLKSLQPSEVNLVSNSPLFFTFLSIDHRIPQNIFIHLSTHYDAITQLFTILFYSFNSY